MMCVIYIVKRLAVLELVKTVLGYSTGEGRSCNGSDCG